MLAMPENNTRLASAVKLWIERRGLTQATIAARGGPSSTTMTKVLKGVGSLRPGIFADLDRGLLWGEGTAERVWRGQGVTPAGFDWRSVDDDDLLEEVARRMREGGGTNAGSAASEKTPPGVTPVTRLTDRQRRALEGGMPQEDAADKPDVGQD